MFELYIANKNYSSWSLRPWILMTQLGIPFDERLTPFATDNWETFRHFSPTGKVPCLVDKDTTVWDSLAIAEYLAENYSRVWPQDRARRAWARCAAAEMHSGFFALREQCSMSCAVRIRLNSMDAALQKDIDRIDELWCEGLGRFGGPWLAGDQFTAVDAFFSPVAFRIQTYGLRLSATAMAYVQRLLDLDAMQQWQSEAICEPWIDESHEVHCLQNGVLLSDARQPASG